MPKGQVYSIGLFIPGAIHHPSSPLCGVLFLHIVRVVGLGDQAVPLFSEVRGKRRVVSCQLHSSPPTFVGGGYKWIFVSTNPVQTCGLSSFGPCLGYARRYSALGTWPKDFSLSCLPPHTSFRGGIMILLA